MTGVAERITWLGHATALLEIGGARVLTDPLLRDRLWHLRRQAPTPRENALKGLDAVLVSHLHHDHLDAPSLRRLDPALTVVVPRGAGDLLRRIGFQRTVELGVGERISVGGAEITAVRADHEGRRGPWGPSAETLGFVVAGARRVWFAGDTELYDGIGALRGSVDVALLPIWGWGPTLGAGHMDPHSAARAAALVEPRIAIPIHWGTFFPAGLRHVRGSALTEPPRAFARLTAELAPGVETRILAPGETLALDA